MPAFLENKLKSEYGQDSKIPFAVMNKMGVMHGNQETDLGREMDAKHSQKTGLQKIAPKGGGGY